MGFLEILPRQAAGWHMRTAPELPEPFEIRGERETISGGMEWLGAWNFEGAQTVKCKP